MHHQDVSDWGFSRLVLPIECEDVRECGIDFDKSIVSYQCIPDAEVHVECLSRVESVVFHEESCEVHHEVSCSLELESVF